MDLLTRGSAPFRGGVVVTASDTTTPEERNRAVRALREKTFIRGADAFRAVDILIAEGWTAPDRKESRS